MDVESEKYQLPFSKLDVEDGGFFPENFISQNPAAQQQRFVRESSDVLIGHFRFFLDIWLFLGGLSFSGGASAAAAAFLVGALLVSALAGSASYSKTMSLEK